MSVLVRGLEAEVCDLEVFEVRHLFRPHIIPGSFRVPVEEDGADLADFARNITCHGALWKIIF